MRSSALFRLLTHTRARTHSRTTALYTPLLLAQTVAASDLCQTLFSLRPKCSDTPPCYIGPGLELYVFDVARTPSPPRATA